LLCLKQWPGPPWFSVSTLNFEQPIPSLRGGALCRRSSLWVYQGKKQCTVSDVRGTKNDVKRVHTEIDTHGMKHGRRNRENRTILLYAKKRGASKIVSEPSTMVGRNIDEAQGWRKDGTGIPG